MNRILRHLVCLSAFLLPLQSGEALGPHESLVLVNSNSPRSKQIANHYARLRQIPPRNIVYLSLPDSVLEAAAEISPEDFTRFIWNPANEVARQRKIDDHILAWIYSVDFPGRVGQRPGCLFKGITFTRNNSSSNGADSTKAVTARRCLRGRMPSAGSKPSRTRSNNSKAISATTCHYQA